MAMKKSTKGAIAAATAAVLLTGGAGTLAYWNADGDITGGTITAGEMKLTAPTGSVWKLNGTPLTAPQFAALKIVPGDELEYTAGWTIEASGDNLQADVAFTGLGDTGDLSTADGVNVTENYTLDNVAVDLVGTTPDLTELNDGQLLQAKVTIDFDFDSAENVSQNQVLNLANGGVTLTQTDATP